MADAAESADPGSEQEPGSAVTSAWSTEETMDEIAADGSSGLSPELDSGTSASGIHALLPVLVLICAHLPFAFIHYRESWSLEHYQFFPFALASFGWLIWTRRDSSSDNWSVAVLVFLAVDLLLLLAAVVKLSPWLAVAALVCGLTGLSLAVRERSYTCSMLAMSFLPLLTLRIPLNYDDRLIHWLQQQTTKLASAIGHRIGLEHYTEGNTLAVPGKHFLVEEACSGVNSLFTIMFIAAFVVAARRRSVIHGLLLIAAGFVVAALMNTLRVLSVIVAWDVARVDLAVGWIHDLLGYVVLILAAAFLMSADAFFDWLTQRIPDVKRPGAMSIYRNPLIRLWNLTLATATTQTKATSLTGVPISKRFGLALGALSVLAAVGQVFVIVQNKLL